MPTGTVRRVFLDRGFGYIGRDDNGEELHFRKSACPPGVFETLARGVRIDFEVSSNAKGPTARAIRLLGQPAGRPAPAEAFVNPYNFVRWLPVPGTGDAAHAPLLLRAPPPPRDRYVGLTGIVRCSLETVTETFVADSRDVETRMVGGKSHRTYDHFHLPDGLPAVPASSLRGVIRGVFEAATNSCFLLMSPGKRHKYYVGGERRHFDLTPGDLAPEHLKPCADPNALCPACRTFGWVAGDPEGDRAEGAPAYRSRVRFSDAVFPEDAMVHPSKPRALQVLGAPKPSYVWFYLMRVDGTVRDGLPIEQAGYRTGNAIRGRKMYWHREELAEEAETCTDQNRSIRSWLGPGKTARFEVRFENLDPVELGALLWSLELEGDQVHRLGYGKALGYGSVKVRVNEVASMADNRYDTDAGGSGWVPVPEPAWRGCVDEFRRQLARLHSGRGDAAGLDDFLDLRNIGDLMEILSDEQLDEEIAYPRRSSTDHGFEWFQENKQGRRLALPLASDENPALSRS